MEGCLAVTGTDSSGFTGCLRISAAAAEIGGTDLGTLKVDSSLTIVMFKRLTVLGRAVPSSMSAI